MTYESAVYHAIKHGSAIRKYGDGWTLCSNTLISHEATRLLPGFRAFLEIPPEDIDQAICLHAAGFCDNPYCTENVQELWP